MAENPKLGGVRFDALSSSCKACELDKMGGQNMSVSEQTSSLQFANFKSDSFIVDMERLSHIADKDNTTANSRLTLQRSLSRKPLQQRGNEKKTDANIGNQKDNSGVPTSSPRAALGATNPENPMVVKLGTTDHPNSSQVHHQITIMTGNIGGAGSAEGRWSGKRFSFRRTIDPRKILLFFATLSSMGTLLLIYFTLSASRVNGD